MLAAYEYAVVYVVTTFGVLGWLWWRRSPAYGWARNTLASTTLVAIGCFVLWPATPPRLLPGSGYLDVVALHRPPGSWGSRTVSAGADQYAAMPSLHVGWAVWVAAVTVRAHTGRIGRSLAALHLLITTLVALATANHYMLDVAAGVTVVGLAALAETGCARIGEHRGPTGAQEIGPWSGRAMRRVAAEDAFFLHVESSAVPQQVGGVALLDVADLPAGAPTLAEVRAMVRVRLPRLPRLSQRVAPPGRLRAAAWVHCDVDVDVHINEVTLLPRSGRRGLEDFVGCLAAVPLDRDRPLWRMWLVRGVRPTEAAVVVLMHHAIADGLGLSTSCVTSSIRSCRRSPRPPGGRVGPAGLPRSSSGSLSWPATVVRRLSRSPARCGQIGSFGRWR